MPRCSQPVERKALNLVVVGSSPTVGALRSLPPCPDSTQGFGTRGLARFHSALLFRCRTCPTLVPSLLPPSPLESAPMVSCFHVGGTLVCVATSWLHPGIGVPVPCISGFLKSLQKPA